MLVLAAPLAGSCAATVLPADSTNWKLTGEDASGERWLIGETDGVALGGCVADPVEDCVLACIGELESRLGHCVGGGLTWQEVAGRRVLRTRVCVSRMQSENRSEPATPVYLRIVATGTWWCRDLVQIPLSQDGQRVLTEAWTYWDGIHPR